MYIKESLQFITPTESSEDYCQSANSLFHFMNRATFLQDALLHKALIPRFCLEDVRYLNLNDGEQSFEEIAILQKCFCDIPLHKVAATFELSLTEECKRRLNDFNHTELISENNHPGFYGKFAISFSKKWCEIKNMQPVHYLNSEGAYARDFSSIFKMIVGKEELSSDIADDFLHRLALMKPLRGKMKRTMRTQKEQIEIEVHKNFHDEQEWRYIPDLSKVEKLNGTNDFQIAPIIANPRLVAFSALFGENYINGQSQIVCRKEWEPLWLRFDYGDIRYLIVPDNQARLEIIDYIMYLPSSNFSKRKSKKEKYILISKILVLDEIGKDW